MTTPKPRLNVYRDADDGAWIADILNAPAGEEWSGSYWTREDATREGLLHLDKMNGAATDH